MAGQLGHLLDASHFPPVTLGVIPFSADGRPMWTLETFTVFDDSGACRTAVSPGDSHCPERDHLYARAFDRLAGTAVYGPSGARLIASAIDVLS